MADGDSGLRVIDVSNPTNPQEIAYYDTPGSARGVYVTGGYAYVADGDSGLRVIDVSNPPYPREIGYYDTPGNAHGVHVTGNYAYVADGWGVLRVIDVSDPANPQEVGSWHIRGYAYDVYVVGVYAYLADGGAGLRVIDVGNPTYPHAIGHYDTPGGAYDVYVTGGYAYVAVGGAGLRVIDVSDPSDPHKIAYYNVPGYTDTYVKGNYAYTTFYGEIVIIDLNDLSNPHEISRVDIPGQGTGIYVKGNYAYVTVNPGSLVIVNVSDPTNPYEVGSCPIPRAGKIFVDGDYAYIAAGDSGLRVIDVSDPTNPYEIGFCYTFMGRGAVNVFVKDGYAYVATAVCCCNDGDVNIIDVRDPTNPHIVSRIGGHAYECYSDVHVVGEYAYLAGNHMEDDYSGDTVIFIYYGFLKVVDISDPSHPQVVAGAVDDLTANIYAVSPYVYTVNMGRGLQMWTMQDLHRVAYYQFGWTYSLSVLDGYAYVWCNGLRIIGLPVPVAVFPENGDTINEHSIRFVWKPPVYRPYTMQYTVYLDSTVICSSITDTTCTATVPDGHHEWWVDLNYSAHSSFRSESKKFYVGTPSIEESQDQRLPSRFELLGVLRNPVEDGFIDLRLAIPSPCLTDFSLYDVTGRQVWHTTRHFEAGYHDVKLRADLRSGVYFIEVSTPFGKANTKVVVSK